MMLLSMATSQARPVSVTLTPARMLILHRMVPAIMRLLILLIIQLFIQLAIQLETLLLSTRCDCPKQCPVLLPMAA
jgi:hypothetical protein